MPHQPQLLHDLWMSTCSLNTFTLVINFLSPQWEPHHVIMGLFDANDIMKVGLARQLKGLLERFQFTFKILCYVKDEGTNLGTMTTTLKYVMTCETLTLPMPFNCS